MFIRKLFGAMINNNSLLYLRDYNNTALQKREKHDIAVSFG